MLNVVVDFDIVPELKLPEPVPPFWSSTTVICLSLMKNEMNKLNQQTRQSLFLVERLPPVQANLTSNEILLQKWISLQQNKYPVIGIPLKVAQECDNFNRYRGRPFLSKKVPLPLYVFTKPGMSIKVGANTWKLICALQILGLASFGPSDLPLPLPVHVEIDPPSPLWFVMDGKVSRTQNSRLVGRRKEFKTIRGIATLQTIAQLWRDEESNWTHRHDIELPQCLTKSKEKRMVLRSFEGFPLCEPFAEIMIPGADDLNMENRATACPMVLDEE